MSFGDPDAMRSQAATLRVRAETVALLASGLDGRVQGIEYEGPAADRFRTAMADRRQRGEQAVAELQDMADYLLRLAAWAEAEIAEMRRQEQLRLQGGSF